MTPIDSRPLLTLAQAAERLQWSVRTLQRKLAEHGIGTVGRRRLARLTEQDLVRLIEAERKPVPARFAPVPRSGPGSMRAIARQIRLEFQAKEARGGAIAAADRRLATAERIRRSKAVGRILRNQ